MLGVADWARFSNHYDTQKNSEVNAASNFYGAFSSIEVREREEREERERGGEGRGGEGERRRSTLTAIPTEL